MRFAITAFVAFALAARLAGADVPRGPEFGDGRISAEILHRGTTEDADDYVAHLVAGDVVSAGVAAGKKSSLRPTLTLLDAEGTVVESRSAARRGRSVSATLKVPSTGLWTIRVAGADSTEGAYTLRTRIRPAKAPKPARGRLGGADPPTAFHLLEAVEGSALRLRLTTRAASPAVTVRSITSPSGADVPISGGTLRRNGRKTTLDGIVLTGGDGAYRIDFGIDEGEAAYTLALGAVPPARTRPSLELEEEPWMTLPTIEGRGGELAYVDGAYFPTVPPRPAAWIGGVPAPVVAVDASGLRLGVVPPAAPGDTLADVTIQNPDGQTFTRRNHFHYIPSGPLDVASITPNYARVTAGTVFPFTVTLTRLAPPGGADVTVALVGDGLGVTETTVHVPGNLAQAQFHWNAGAAPATGSIEATLLSTVTADVGIVPAPVLTAIEPASVSLNYLAQQQFTLVLDSPATTGGAEVELTIPGALGLGPRTVRVDGGQSSAKFTFTATGGPRASLQIMAKLGHVAVYSSVTVAPPSEMDLSGWTLLQRTETGFETTFTIPDGTVLKEGHYLFVARDSSVTQFSQAWGLDPAWFSGPNAVLHHVNGGEGFPNVDGKHEKFELKNGDSIVDGPTIRMSALGVYGFVRIPGGSAGAIKSWWADLMSNYTIGPGMGAPTPSKPAGLYISVIADTATGHDWVEIFFDAYP